MSSHQCFLSFSFRLATASHVFMRCSPLLLDFFGQEDFGHVIRWWHLGTGSLPFWKLGQPLNHPWHFSFHPHFTLSMHPIRSSPLQPFPRIYPYPVLYSLGSPARGALNTIQVGHIHYIRLSEPSGNPQFSSLSRVGQDPNLSLEPLSSSICGPHSLAVCWIANLLSRGGLDQGDCFLHLRQCTPWSFPGISSPWCSSFLFCPISPGFLGRLRQRAYHQLWWHQASLDEVHPHY